jgi:hypothetical protein
MNCHGAPNLQLLWFAPLGDESSQETDCRVEVTDSMLLERARRLDYQMMLRSCGYRMYLAAIAAIITFSTGISAISCFSGSNICISKQFADADTCASCIQPNRVQLLLACSRSSFSPATSCFSQRISCERNHGGVFTSCQTSNCNTCALPLPDSWLENTNISFPSFMFPFRNGAVVFLPMPFSAALQMLSGLKIVSFCVTKSNWKSFLPPKAPFPFGNDPSVMSVLIWENSAVFSFSSSDCSGESQQPHFLLPPQTVTQTMRCFLERNSQATSVSVSQTSQVLTYFLLAFQTFPLMISSQPNQDCSNPPTESPAKQALPTIDLLTEYVIPLLSLAISCRSLLFRPHGSRLILPQFSRLWISHSPRQDRCAAWFLTSTFQHFVTTLCLAAIELSGEFSSTNLTGFSFIAVWFRLFPKVVTLRPLMVCTLFSPDRIISIVACMQGCLMAVGAFIRIQFLPDWMSDIFMALGIISFIPALMFASTSALIVFHPAEFKINQHDHRAMKIAVRICNLVFGCSRPTLIWHHARTDQLVNALNRGHKAADALHSQESLISAPNPMSARMLTLLYTAVFWTIYWFFFFAFGVLSLISYFQTFAESTYRNIPILLLRILVVTFVVVLLYHLFESLSKYRARYARMSSLCRRGFVPYGIQSSTSFHLAAKFMATEAIDVVTGKLLIYVFILMIIVVVILFFIALQWISQNFGVSIQAQLEWLLLTFFVLPLFHPLFLSTIFIVFVCNCLGSTWLSPIRLFDVEHTLLKLPMRYANIFCLRIRCVCN